MGGAGGGSGGSGGDGSGEGDVAGGAEGTLVTVGAPVQGSVVQVPGGAGDTALEGSPLVVIESMKMEHVVRSPVTGVVRMVAVEVGALVAVGDALATVEAVTETDGATEGAREAGPDASSVDPELVRPDLQELLDRQLATLDAGRPQVVERRHGQGRRTARENIDDLCDPGSFIEYGSLAIAAQRGRRPVEELIERTPADGLVAGVGRVNGEYFDDGRARCAVLSYDYTVMAGTQGAQNHRKKDRLFELVRRLRSAGGPLRRGWGRASGGHRLRRHLGAGHPGLRRVRGVERAGPVGGGGLGLLLRRKRCAARLL